MRKSCMKFLTLNLISSKSTIKKSVIISIYKMNKMYINILRQSMAMLILPFVFLSCQSNSTKQDDKVVSDTLHIEHKLGKQIIPKTPKRSVVLDIGALETMNELGITPVGVPKKFVPSYLKTIHDNPDVADVGS